jgi:hypothetical protein
MDHYFSKEFTDFIKIKALAQQKLAEIKPQINCIAGFNAPLIKTFNIESDNRLFFLIN